MINYNMLLYVILATSLGTIHASQNHTKHIIRVVRPNYPFWIFIVFLSLLAVFASYILFCKVAPEELKKRRARFKELNVV